MIYDHEGNPVEPQDVLTPAEHADHLEDRNTRHRAQAARRNRPTPQPHTDPWPVERDDDWTPALAAAVAKLRRIGGER